MRKMRQYEQGFFRTNSPFNHFILHDLEEEAFSSGERQAIASKLEKLINENQLIIDPKALDQRTKSYLKELKAFVKG